MGRRVFSVFAFLSAALVLAGGRALAGEPLLTIRTNGEVSSYSTSDLLKRSDVETLTITNDPAYGGQSRAYRAVKVTNLITDGIKDKSAIYSFKASDGFVAPITSSRLLATEAESSIAYIAIEPPAERWPAVSPGKPSAGPFYLIWKNPELSKISREEWPYMVVAIEYQGDLRAIYPEIFPKKGLGKSDPVMLGLDIFVRNCFACHTINNSGAGQIGPDLNIPMNPTEYFHESALRTLIRNPQDLRKWPNTRMIGFSEKVLPEKDLDNLIAYLRHMVTQRPKPAPKG